MLGPRIKAHQIMPPLGGWRLKYELKGQEFTFSGSPTRIVQGIASLQIKNNVYKGQEPIWEYCNKIWCERDPKRCMTEEQAAAVTVGMKSKLETFARAIKSLVDAGMEPVPLSQAEKRAEVCMKCPKNRSTGGCGACRAAANLITKGLIGNRHTRYDRKLKDCAVCGCVNKLKIHYPLNEGDKNIYPDYCWVTKEKAAKKPEE